MWRPPARSIAPEASTVSLWQRLHSMFCGCGSGGGDPWQEPHAVGPADTAVHVGVGVEPPAPSVAPWQYVDAHVAPFQAGVVPCDASPVNGSEIAPFTCVKSETGAWQALHASPLRIVPVTTCFWCAPTARCVVSVSPFVPAGGAGFAPSVPWQAVHPPPSTCTVPSTCFPPARSIAPLASTVPEWQRAQSVVCGCGNGGGAPWQEPQVASDGPPVQSGAGFEPRWSVAPWQ